MWKRGFKYNVDVGERINQKLVGWLKAWALTIYRIQKTWKIVVLTKHWINLINPYPMHLNRFLQFQVGTFLWFHYSQGCPRTFHERNYWIKNGYQFGCHDKPCLWQTILDNKCNYRIYRMPWAPCIRFMSKCVGYQSYISSVWRGLNKWGLTKQNNAIFSWKISQLTFYYN